MATKSKNSGLSKCTSDPVDDTGQERDEENTEIAMYMSNGGMMNGTDENSTQLWTNTEYSTDNTQKRLSHNIVERKRKEKIKKWIGHIGALLPSLPHTTEKPSSTLETMERAASYITELKGKYEQLLVAKGGSVQVDEIKELRKQLEDTKLERDSYAQIIKNAGISIDPQWKTARFGRHPLPNGELNESQSPKEEEKIKGKSKRKNTVSVQLESVKLQQEQNNQALNNVFPGIFGGVGNQNMLLNSGFPNGNQVVMTPNGHVVMPMNQMTNALQNGQNMLLDKSANGLGLLQMAMQDAGITEISRQPSPDNNSQREGSQSSNVNNDSLSTTSTSSMAEDPNHALQTLASVASNPQNAVLTPVSSSQPAVSRSTVGQTLTSTVAQSDTTTSCVSSIAATTNIQGVQYPTTTGINTSMPCMGFVPGGTVNNSAITTTAVTSTAPPIMSVGPGGVNQLANQGNMMVNMPMNPGQINLLPPNNFGLPGMGGMFMNQQGQLIMINEQGVPIMAGMNNNMPNVLPQQDQPQQNIPVPKGCKKDKNSKKANTVQPSVINQNVPDQMNMTSVMTSQGQMNILQPQQGTMNMLQQNIMQQPNMMQSMPMQGQQQVAMPGTQNVFQQQFPNQPMVQMQPNNTGSQNQGIILPANQSGNLLTLNTMPSQPNQLPSALILPNGQVIPVVQNAQSLINNQSGVLTSGGQVVTNSTSLQMPLQQMGVGMPNTVMGNMANMDLNNQMMLGNPGFQMGSQAPLQQSSMGILMHDHSNNQQTIATSAQNLTNSVVPTSSTQSIMTTQIQNTTPALVNSFSYQKSVDNPVPMSAADGSVSIMPRNPIQASVRATAPDLKNNQANNQSSMANNPQGMATIAQGMGTPGPQIGPNGSILLTLPIDGQQMSVLVDPVTMQVLGRVPQPTPTNTITPTSTTATTTGTTTAAATTPATAAKKSVGGKKAPRICPKPNQAAKKSKNKSLSPAAEVQPPTDSEPQQLITEASHETPQAVPEETPMDHGLSSEESAAMTDILAKAAESIGFYNPANEDNPLHIDTSAGETEDDGSASPSKAKTKTQETIVEDKHDTDDITSVLNMEPLLKSPEDTLTMNLPTEEDFNETVEACATPNKKSKKSKALTKEKEETLDTPKMAKKSSKKKKKDDDPNMVNALTMAEPVFDLPAEITFSESQLSDVLDQVEKLDSSFTETPKKPSKKKSKSDESELPASKKRKKSSGKDKGNTNVAQTVPDNSATLPVSQPESRMSIYDFQDDSPPEVSPVRKGVLSSLSAKSVNDTHKIMKETRSIADSLDDLDSVLSQSIEMKVNSPKNTSKSSRTKSKSSSKKKKSKTEVKPAPESEIVEPEKFNLPSPANIQTTMSMEQNLNNLLTSQNIDFTPSSDLVSSPLAKMIDPLDDIPSVTSPVQSHNQPQHTNSLQDQIASTQSQPSPQIPNPSIEDAIRSPSSCPNMEPPPPLTPHQHPQRSDSNKHKTPPYNSPASQPPIFMPSKPSPSTHMSMHPSPQHQQSSQSQPSVPLSHLPNPSQRSSTMLPPQDSFQTHKSPAHLSPAQSMISPPNMRNNLDQNIVSPSNMAIPSSARELNTSMRSNPDPNIISPPNVTMATMHETLNTSQEQSIVSPPNLNLGTNRSGADIHQAFDHPSSLSRVPETTPIFPPTELPCSNEPLFPSPIASIPKLSHIETSPIKPPSRNSSGSNSDGPSQRSRNSIYSAENFVQSSPSRSNDSRPSQDSSQLSSCFGRPPAENTSESFNFTSIGMNLTSNTSSNVMAGGMSMSSASTPFSFSLTPASSVLSSSSGGNNSASLPSSHGHHPLSFYPPLHLQPPGQPNNSQENPNPQQQGMNMLPLGVDLRNNRPHSRQMSNGPPNQNTFNFGMMDMNDCVSRESSLPPRLSLPGMEKNHQDFRSGNSSSKRVPELTPARSMTSGPMEHNLGSRSQVSSASSYFQPANFNQPPSSLMTPPLRHPPMQSNERSRLSHQPPYDPNFQPRGPALSSGSFGANRFDNSNNGQRPTSSVHYDSTSNINQNVRKSNSNPPHKQNKQSHPTSGSIPSTNHPMPPQNTSSQSTPLSHRDMPSAPAQPVRQKSQSRKQNSKKNKLQSFNPEMDTNLSHSIFDSNQGMPPNFFVPTLSPNPNRNLQSEGPSFLHGNLFGGTPRPLSNTGSGPKNSDIGVPFNPLFNPSRTQNSLAGLNFQPGFGMNHVSASSAPQITPHSGNVAMPPHIMSNFNLSNIFTDVNNSQSDSLNISPIKFPHGNHMLPQHGMDPNSLQHHHQNSALYHNRGHPGQQQALHNAMAINSLLGHNPHGFDVRPMGQGINSSVGPPFHGPGHPGSFGIPSLNFSLHDSH
ncbi:hypothetical protein SNE40_016604 [Patella caerulea]|uniref:BHLH domain-containing protein n=1 Tax=Patella caerulea TaxID=87958 RepID=A0AAN8JDK4_PATCE